MLISLIGPPGSGKTSVAYYLATQHDFRLLTLKGYSAYPLFFGNTSTVALDDAKTMLDYVTDRWEKKFVTMDLTSVGDAEAFIKRPFFLCVEVGGPVMMRWERFQRKHGKVGLEKFVKIDDEESYGNTRPPSTSSNGTSATRTPLVSTDSSRSLVGGNGIVDNLSAVSLSPPSIGLNALRRFVHLSITNSFPTLSALDAHLTSLNLPSPDRLRPGWDSYFLRLCNLASLRSNCMKRRVGAVLVSSNRILSTGYNGTPSGLKNCNQGGCSRCNNTLTSSGCGQNLEECLCLHAEENALLEAGRSKISGGPGVGEGAVMYCNTCPCLRCAVKIIQTGIRKVVYQLEYSMDERTKAIFKEAGVEIRQVHLDA